MKRNEQINLEDSSWIAVRVGPHVLGWVGSYLNDVAPVLTSDMNILMGNTVIPLDFLEFDRASIETGRNGDDTGILIHRFGFYARRFVIPVPVGSLDMTAEGEIEFSDLSWDTLRTSLHNFFSALIHAVQAELNTLPPAKVVRKLVELQSYGYPMSSYNKLSWRGATPPMTTYGSEMQTVVIKENTNSAPPRRIFLLGLLDADFALPNGEYLPKLCDISFNAFVNLQSRSSFLRPKGGVPLMAPENVFLIRASSDHEREKAEQLLLNRDLLSAFLRDVRPGAQEASVFLCTEGDTLEEWVDGDVLSARDFLRWAEGSSFRERALQPTSPTASKDSP